MTANITDDPYVTDEATGTNWTLKLGDSCERLAEIKDNSVDLAIYSPPFASLFVYSPSIRDLGNSSDRAEFFAHYSFIISEMLRVTKPGRINTVHVQQLTTTKASHGIVGLTDFRGEVIRAYQEAGWIFHGEITVDKDPQAQAIRTKAQALMFVQKNKDSLKSRPALADYLLLFRKPGEIETPVKTDVTNDEWIVYARPIWQGTDDEGTLTVMQSEGLAVPDSCWYGIRESNTLNVAAGRDGADERHICLAAGSLVLTRDGYLPIEGLAVGAEVLTHMGRWQRILAKRNNGIEPVIRSCAQGVADLRTTPDHKLWTRRGAGSKPKDHAKASVPEWVPASDVLGSYLNLKLPPIEDVAVTADECWMIGRWLGDGHRADYHGRSKARGGTGQFIISCSHGEAEGLLVRLGDHAGHAATNRTAVQVALRNLSPVARSILARCGKGAAGKVVPGELLALPAVKAEALLAGYLSADGHYVERHDRVAASSTSRALLLGMAMIAQRARGVVASVYAGRPERKHVIEGRTVRARQDWIFSFRNSPGYRQSGWIGEDGAWKKVRKSEPAGYAEVWDIRVEGDASFVAEGAVVKNCPLQLDLIERCVRLWSNVGETVLSPFAGIGSEGYVSVQQHRRFVGIELKASYWRAAVANLKRAEAAATAATLFDDLPSA